MSISSVYTGNSEFPPLAELIAGIDKRIAQRPQPYALENTDAFLGSLGLFKRRGRPYIRFGLNQLQFALPMDNAIEITYRPEITSLPNIPAWVMGVSNIRGDIISVVDIKTIFNLPPDPNASSAHLILIRYSEIVTGIVVDKVWGVIHDAGKDDYVNAKVDLAFKPFIKGTLEADQQEIHLIRIERLMDALKIESGISI